MDVPPRLPTHQRPAPVTSLRPPLLLTLLLVAFAGGVLVARLLWPAAARDRAAVSIVVTPAAPTPVPPTSVPVATPTPTSANVGDVLETLYIDVAPDDFATIEAKRQEALERWILLASDADYVPGTVTWRDQVIPVELRLKGDWADHIARDKWSFRIRTKGGQYLWGMRVFSVQDPGTRTYLNEWLFLQSLRAEGVLTVGYRFAHVVLNGEYKGVYAVEEGFAKELVESQRRREGVIVRYNEDLLWEYWAAYADDLVTPRGVLDFHVIDEFTSGRVNANPVLAAQRDAAVGALRGLEAGAQPASAVFDVETLAKFLALSDVWGAQHALAWHNLRFYYNPVTARLEPVAFDAQPLESVAGIDVTLLKGLREVVAYDDVTLQQAYARSLWAYSQPDYLDRVRAQSGVALDVLRDALAPEFGGYRLEDGREALALPWDALAQRQASLRELLSPLQMVYAYVPSDAPDEVLTVDVGNLLDFPIEIVGLVVDGDVIPARPDWTGAAAPAGAAAPVLPPLPLETAFMPYTRLRVPWAHRRASALTLETRIWGLTRTVTQTVMPAYPPPLADGALPDVPSVNAALAQHPYLTVADGDRILTVLPGTWDVQGDLVLPEGYGLRLEAGTTLRFGPENLLLATGPLVFDGTADAPVVLEPSGDTWRGVVVLDAGAPSLWHYTTVRATEAVARAGWALTGGITFYRSPLRLDHSRILGTVAEDGLNVIDTRFEFVDSEFVGTRSDAFDGDFVQGTVERCVFYDVGADAIDVSGSDVQVRDARLLDVADKGLSVGEASRLRAENVVITNADFGVVSKDLSQVTLTGVTIESTRIAGLAAYTKKLAYGPASIVADGVTFVDVPAMQQTLVQTGSWIDLEGARIWGRDVDIEALYEKWQR